ncbi:MAG: HNH endonuclease signature motif containing protein, partial [Nocardioides sp.]
TIGPVLPMDRDDAIDPHDPPGWMRDLILLRDPTCVFPHCQRDSRACDIDHTTPYDEHGPAGQTRPDNLTPLCRRHHRAKTTGRWTYQRLPDGTHAWTGPGID